MADATYLDIVIFQESGKDRTKKPRVIGWAKIENGEAKGRIDVMPAYGWDGSFKIQERRERTDAGNGGDGGKPRTRAEPTAHQQRGGGYGARAPTPQQDTYAPSDDSDDIPFASSLLHHDPMARRAT